MHVEVITSVQNGMISVTQRSILSEPARDGYSEGSGNLNGYFEVQVRRERISNSCPMLPYNHLKSAPVLELLQNPLGVTVYVRTDGHDGDLAITMRQGINLGARRLERYEHGMVV